MATRSQKFKDFVSEPMRNKTITEVDGIDEELGSKLAADGFDKAYILLGQFLLLKKDAPTFQQWLEETFGASSKQAVQCATCLAEWCYSII